MFKSREGERVPQVTFHMRKDNKWVDVTTDDLFKGKTVIVFSLPGAFTPTCSASHLPGYEELAPAFKENGVDSIICVSVNDPFVMNAWAEDQGVKNVIMLPDGNGEFTEKMGMLVDKSNIGFGKRSWRYSMLVKDGVIEKMFIEPEKEGDPFEVSDAETMLKYINANAKRPQRVALFTKARCPYCAAAKELLAKHGFKYEEIPLGKEVTVYALRAVTGSATVPQIYIDGKHIGGLEDLKKHLEKTMAAV